MALRTKRCLVKIREMKSPYHSEFRGYRVVVATPNWAGHKPFSSEVAPSFDRPYLIVQFGDYEDLGTLEVVRPRIDQELTRRGFEIIEWLAFE